MHARQSAVYSQPADGRHCRSRLPARANDLGTTAERTSSRTVCREQFGVVTTTIALKENPLAPARRAAHYEALLAVTGQPHCLVKVRNSTFEDFGFRCLPAPLICNLSLHFLLLFFVFSYPVCATHSLTLLLPGKHCSAGSSGSTLFSILVTLLRTMFPRILAPYLRLEPGVLKTVNLHLEISKTRTRLNRTPAINHVH